MTIEAENDSLPVFDFQPRTRVVFGVGASARLGELARELGGRRVLLVTDPGMESAGHPQRAEAILRNAGLEVFVFNGVEENPTTRQVEAGRQFARQSGVDLIVAVGGGSTMDCAKGINFLLGNGGSLADSGGFGKTNRSLLPSLAVPTTAGTGSEAQSATVIADEKSHIKMSCGDGQAAFRLAILDPEVTTSQPAKLTASSGIDAIAHAVESHVCTRTTPLSQAYSRAAWRLLGKNLEIVLRQPQNLEARSAMQLAANFAGTAVENAMLGACHACANPLSAHYGLAHGVALGIMLPHVIRFNASIAAPLYADLVSQMGTSAPTAEASSDVLAQRVTDLMKMGGLPVTLSKAGVGRGILPLLASEAAQQWTARFNPRPVSEDEILQMYEEAY